MLEDMKFFASEIKKGFTLVEMLVAIAIFMIVVTTTLGAFLKMVDINKKVQSVRTTMDNANLAMETMMRNIRLGYDYESLDNGTAIRFTSQDGSTITYGLVERQTEVQTGARTFRMVRTVNGASPVPITSPDIAIERLEFVVSGAAVSPADTIQANVKIFVKGKTELPKNEHNFDFSFQSLATQRLYDK